MNSKHADTTGFLDLFLNIVVTFVFLFFISWMLIAINEKKADVKKPKAEFLLTITWPDGCNDDVDIYVRDPIGNIIWFRNRDVGLVSLDRDDKGSLGDRYIIAGNRVIESERNQEIISIRGFIEGDWKINVHMYAKRDVEPTSVRLSLDKLNPSVYNIFTKDIVLENYWQEETVMNFIMSNDGSISSEDDTIFESLVKEVGLGRTLPSNSRREEPIPQLRGEQ